MDIIDFRSDTVTWPTKNMRKAMAEAAVGDDVYGEDPTVAKLESMAAELVGKEAALFVSSGTMGNITAILSHTTRGDEAIAGWDTHTLTDEGGGLSVLGGVIPRTLQTDEIGRMDLGEIDAAVNPDDPHYARTRLILLENSYGAKNGAPIPTTYFQEVRRIADSHGLAVHLDGARMFNAAAALGIEAKQLTSEVDSVSFCLSKGLCAPIGSVLCGSEAFIHKAVRIRKVLGGGMRQAGIIAAAGVVALEEMVDRLAEDNANARYLARGLEQIDGLLIDSQKILTNIVFFDIEPELKVSAEHIVKYLQLKNDILIGAEGERKIRVVTHYWVGRMEIDLLLTGMEEALQHYRSRI